MVRVHHVHVGSHQTSNQPTSSDLDQLKVLPFVVSSELSNLKSELASYLAKASQVNAESDVKLLKWWETHASELPCWSSTFKKVLLIQPSSAASERVFLLLNNSFNDHQQNSLEDMCRSINNVTI